MKLFGRDAAENEIVLRFPVCLKFTIRSEEMDESALLLESPVTEVQFEKRARWLCPPNVGLSVGGPFGLLEVNRVLVGRDEVFCELPDSVVPQKRLDLGLVDFKQKMIDDGWTVAYEHRKASAP